MFSSLSFAILFITSHLLIEFILTNLLLLHHYPLPSVPSAVCSSHFHLTSTFCSIFPSVFCCRYWEASKRRKRPPVVCSFTDNTSLNERLCEAAWQQDLNSSVLTQSQRQIFCIDHRTRCLARSAVRHHCCRGICCYLKSHE